MGRVADGLVCIVTSVRIAYEKEIRYPAAALAYYGFVSFVPFLVLVFAVVDEQVAERVSETAPRFLTPEVTELVNQSLRTAAGKTGTGVLSILVLIWSSTNIVGDIRAVFERIEGDRVMTHRARVRDGIVILGCFGAAIVAIVTTTILSDILPPGVLLDLAWFIGLWAFLTMTFLPMLSVPSTLLTSVRQAVPGAVIVALGLTVLHTGILFYAGNAGQYAIYGVLSGIIIILTSLYLAAATVLTGIIVNAWLVAGDAIRSQ